MDRKEMLERLSKGETPLDVSIQKWRDVVSDLECGVEPVDIDVGPKTCALCERTKDAPNYCTGCPYFEFYGKECVYGAYDDFDYAAEYNDAENAIIAANAMVKELEKIKKGKE